MPDPSSKHKVCMLGAFAVGKTSLVARFVHSMFSERYLTTVGVKVDKKRVSVGDRSVELILWDMVGEDDLLKLRPSHLRGAGGYLLVVDRTRRATVETVVDLQARAEAFLGPVPFVLLLNKSDLVDEFEVDEPMIAPLRGRGWTVLETSAKTGDGVEAAFHVLAERIVTGQRL